MMFNNISKNSQNITSTLNLLFYVALFCGFMILYFYLVDIKYFPINSIISGLSFLLLIAVIGLIFITIITLPLIINSYLWIISFKDKDVLAHLIPIERAELYSSNSNYENCVIERIDAPKLILTYLIFTTIMSVMWIISIQYIFVIPWNYWYFILFIIGVSFLIIFNYLEKANKKNKIVFISYFFMLSFASSGFLLVPYFFSLNFSRWSSYQSYFYFAVFIMYSSLFLYPLKENLSLQKNKIYSSLLASTLLIFAVEPPNFSHSILKKYKIGGMSNVSIEVNRNECIFLNTQSSTKICHQEDNLYLVDNIVLLWRVGEYLIRPISNKKQTFLLPYKGGRTIIFNN